MMENISIFIIQYNTSYEGGGCPGTESLKVSFKQYFTVMYIGAVSNFIFDFARADGEWWLSN